MVILMMISLMNEKHTVLLAWLVANLVGPVCDGCFSLVGVEIGQRVFHPFVIQTFGEIFTSMGTTRLFSCLMVVYCL